MNNSHQALLHALRTEIREAESRLQKRFDEKINEALSRALSYMESKYDIDLLSTGELLKFVNGEKEEKP